MRDAPTNYIALDAPMYADSFACYYFHRKVTEESLCFCGEKFFQVHYVRRNILWAKIQRPDNVIQYDLRAQLP
jgi:hypothetical protein